MTMVALVLCSGGENGPSAIYVRKGVTSYWPQSLAVLSPLGEKSLLRRRSYVFHKEGPGLIPHHFQVIGQGQYCCVRTSYRC